MNIEEAYNNWSSQYDTNSNRTRDLEALALRSLLRERTFRYCLEIGCGTGKNTGWLAEQAERVTAIDFSEKMLSVARQKINNKNVRFINADILQPWNFVDHPVDLVAISLVLEHVKNLPSFFEKLKQVVADQGTVYIGELHPFKQYNGSSARFETDEGTQMLTCFTHAVSDFVCAAKANGFQLMELDEFFDEDNRNTIPRILCLQFKKI